jgi:hypothetical protein
MRWTKEVNTAPVFEHVTEPETGVVPETSVNVCVVSEAQSIASLKRTLTLTFVATSDAPSSGVVDATVGAIAIEPPPPALVEPPLPELFEPPLPVEVAVVVESSLDVELPWLVVVSWLVEVEAPEVVGLSLLEQAAVNAVIARSETTWECIMDFLEVERAAMVSRRPTLDGPERGAVTPNAAAAPLSRIKDEGDSRRVHDPNVGSLIIRAASVGSGDMIVLDCREFCAKASNESLRELPPARICGKK